MRNIFILLIAVALTNCGNDTPSPGNDAVNPYPSNNQIVQNCVTSTGDASVTGNVILVSNIPLTDNSFTIISIKDTYAETTIGTSCVAGIQSNPFAYQVFYNTQDVYTNNTYQVDVNIFEKFNTADYQIRDKSTFIYPVITNGAGTTVDMYAYSTGVIN